MTKPKTGAAKRPALKPANPSTVRLVFDQVQQAAFAMAVYRLRDQETSILVALAENGHPNGAVVAGAARFVLERRNGAAALLAA